MGSLVDISSSEMIGDFSGVALRQDSFIYSFVGQHFITYLLGARHWVQSWCQLSGRNLLRGGEG